MSAKAAAHIFWIQGGERVLIEQACQGVRERYPEASRRSRRIDSRDINWRALTEEITSADLFSPQCLWHIDFLEELPDAAALGFLRDLAFESLAVDRSQQEPSVVVLLSSGILKSAQRKSKWYSKLSGMAGTDVQWPMDGGQTLAWARRQMARHHIRLDDTALSYLMERSEANLSLLDKEMHKLALTAGDGDADFDIERLHASIEGDHSRFNPFDLATTALLEPLDRFVRLVGYFESEASYDINQLLGALRFGLNQLVELSSRAKGGDGGNSMRHLPPQQKKLLSECLRRYNGDRLVRITCGLADAERAARGIGFERPWDALRRWGRRVHAHRQRARAPTRASAA